MCTNEEHVSRYACVPCSQLELERGGTNTWSDILVRPTYRDETEMEAERITETIKLSVRRVMFHRKITQPHHARK